MIWRHCDAVEVVTQEITRLFKRCESRLQKLGGPGRSTPADEKVVTNVQRKLATELQRLSQEFRKMQKDYLQRLKQQQDRGPGGAGVDDIFGGISSGGGGDEDYDPGFSDLQMQRVDQQEAVSFEVGGEGARVDNSWPKHLKGALVFQYVKR